MASNKDVLEGQRFNRRRLVTAFASGTPGGRELEYRSSLRPLAVGAVVAVVILVKLVGRIWLVRGHHRRGRHAGGRWLTAPSALVLLCVLAGAVVLLVDLAYWGLFPMLL